MRGRQEPQVTMLAFCRIPVCKSAGKESESGCNTGLA